MRKFQKLVSSAYKYFFMLIVFAEVTTPGKVAAEAMVTVLDFAFCKKVVDLMPVEPIVDPAVLKAGEKLHLWLDIQINSTGMRYLRSIGKLPVYLRWGRDGWLTDPPLDVGIGADVWETQKDAILWKAGQSRNTFTWRAYTHKSALAAGNYYVSILDANRKVIASAALPVGGFRPQINIDRQ